MRVILVRHAATKGNEEGFIQQDDIRLSPNGERQLEALKSRLAGERIDQIFTSPYTRTKMTAQAIRETHPEAEFHEIEDLRERDNGTFRGRSKKEFAEVRAREQHVFGHWRPPEGESDVDVQERMIKFFNAIAVKYPDSTVLIVSHGSNIANLMMYLRGQPMDLESYDSGHPENAEVTILEWRDGKAEIEVLNDRSHLDK